LNPCGIWLRAEGEGHRERQKIKDQRLKREDFVFMTDRLNGATAQRHRGETACMMSA